MSHRKARKHPRGRAKLQRLLEAAIIRGEASTITALIAEGADPCGPLPSGTSQSALHLACSFAAFRPSTAYIEALLAVNSVNVNATDGVGFKPLHSLLIPSRRVRTTNVLATIRLLVAAGADINAHMTDDGRTPLHLGVHIGKRVVETLISLGADLNARSNEGSSALVHAARGLHLRVVTQMLHAGASLYVPPGVPLLSCVHVLNFASLFHLLLRAGADPAELFCRQTFDSGTALFHTSDFSVMRELVSLGIDVNARDANGRTALFRACPDPALTRFLAQAGVDANVQDNTGATALHSVVRSCTLLPAARYQRIIEALFEAGTDDTIRDNEGHTAMYWARQRGLPRRCRACVKLP